MPAASAISMTADSRSTSTSIRAGTRSPKGPATSQVDNLAAARGNGIERSLTAIRQRQRAYLGIGPHAAHALGNCRLRLRARHAALKGVNRQQHTAGPAARRTKVNCRASILTGTCKRLRREQRVRQDRPHNRNQRRPLRADRQNSYSAARGIHPPSTPAVTLNR